MICISPTAIVALSFAAFPSSRLHRPVVVCSSSRASAFMACFSPSVYACVLSFCQSPNPPLPVIRHSVRWCTSFAGLRILCCMLDSHPSGLFTSSRIRFEELPPIKVKGKELPVAVFRPIEVAALSSSDAASRLLVGREAEVATLLHAIQAAREGFWSTSCPISKPTPKMYAACNTAPLQPSSNRTSSLTYTMQGSVRSIQRTPSSLR